MEPTRVFDILNDLLRDPKFDLLNAKEQKQWKHYSTDDFIHHVNAVSHGLMNLGLAPGDKVAIISNNRPEWNFVDYGAQQAGIITVPIYPTISTTDLSFILNDSGVKALFISSKDIYKKFLSIQSDLTASPQVFSFNPIDEVNSFDSFVQGAQSNPQEGALQERKRQVNPKEVFTILYTSGTTGVPKGVMLSHENILSNVDACFALAPFESSWKALSFLPLNHIYERMVNTVYFRKNISIYYAEGIETIGDNLKEVQPQVFVSVPRLIERVYDKLLSAGDKLTGWKRKLFFASVDFALEFDPQNISVGGRVKRWFFDKLIYKKWRAALGGKVVCIASGGAALQPRLGRVFHCAKIPVLEGYGLTETSPVIAVNCYEQENTRIGTVGPVIHNTEVKIAEDGEILVRGPGVMLGYYNNEQATKDMINEEGWLHTGDIGTFVENRFLKITDRKKEIFKTSSGKYIAPLMIENKIKECRFVEQCCVIGESQKFASALIVVSKDYVNDWAKNNSIALPDDASAVNNPELRKEINAFIREMNTNLAPYEQIKRPELIMEPWTVDGGELTPKMSMKRKVILAKHADLVAKIFSESE
ncbi:MAG: long-chain fatty acid--CoA ligase [Bacteroidetes bacterium]|nr:long-chain fatty acid--CoA ligase [Bacteroidota bacterium]MBM3424478.1 long-chain fatty acid--CoA ligase [Bacteroidota bacterium]